MRPTHDEIIRELTREIALLKDRQATLQNINERFEQLSIQVALLRQRVDDMREGTQAWIQ